MNAVFVPLPSSRARIEIFFEVSKTGALFCCGFALGLVLGLELGLGLGFGLELWPTELFGLSLAAQESPPLPAHDTRVNAIAASRDNTIRVLFILISLLISHSF